MELSDKEIELLERYWFGKLSRSVRDKVKKRMLDDADFRRDANQLKKTINGLHSIREQRVSEYLRKKENSLPPVELKKENIFLLQRKKWIAIGGTVAIIATIIIIYFVRPIQDIPSHQNIAQAYFEPYPYLGQTLSEVDSIAPVYARADFQTAIPLLKKKFNTEKDTLTLFYLGVAFLGNGQADEAVPIFEDIRQSLAVPQEAAQWYFALSLLYQGNTQTAIPLLDSLAISDWKERENARQILDKLEVIDRSN